MILVITACFVACSLLLFRNKPELEDVFFSVLPIFSVLLPGLCILNFFKAEAQYVQNIFIILSFSIPLVGDIFAFFSGKRFGKRKLCPAVSPNKTIEGAIGGLCGSMLSSLICWLLLQLFGTSLPFWHFILLGIVGGVAGQIGDLFASLIKRHCKVKDFGTIFPGHGGMMDRMDSTFFSAVVVFMYFGIAIC